MHGILCEGFNKVKDSYESMFIASLDEWPPNVGFTVPIPGQQIQHIKGTDLSTLYFFQVAQGLSWTAREGSLFPGKE